MSKRKLRHYESVPRPIEARVALYLRYSSYRQAGSTIEKQRMRCHDLLATERGWRVLVEFEEPEQTAKYDEIDRRPRFAAMLDAAKRGEFEVVLVESIDRWGRAEAAMFTSLGILREAGVYWLTADGLWNSENIRKPGYATAFLIGVGEAAQMPRTQSEKTANGKRNRAIQGYHATNHAPFGFKLEDPTLDATGHIKRRDCIPDPEVFPALALIRDLRLQMWGCHDIAVELTRRGYRHPRPGYGRNTTKLDGPPISKLPDRPLFGSTVQNIITNKFYVEYQPGCPHGTIIHDGEEYEGRHPAVFTQEEFQRFQEISKILYRAPRAQKKYHNKYPFGGLLICSACATSIRSWTRDKPPRLPQRYYACGYRGRVICPSKRHWTPCESAEAVFGQVLETIQHAANWQSQLITFLDEEEQESDQDRIVHQIALLEREQKSLNLQHRLGGIDDEEYEREIKRIQHARRLISLPEHSGAHRQQVLKAGERIAEIATCWRAAPLAEKQEMAHLLIQPFGIIWNHDEQRIIGIKPYQEFLPGFIVGLKHWQLIDHTWLWTSDTPIPAWLVGERPEHA